MQSALDASAPREVPTLSTYLNSSINSDIKIRSSGVDREAPSGAAPAPLCLDNNYLSRYLHLRTSNGIPGSKKLQVIIRIYS